MTYRTKQHKEVEDGVYVFYRTPCGSLLDTNELNMILNRSNIVEYIRENFETVDIKEVMNRIDSHKSPIRTGMHFDVVIVLIKNGQIAKYLTFEIADESHRNPKCRDFIDKVISDAIKNKGKKSKTIILHCNQYTDYQGNFKRYLKNNGFPIRP